MNSNTTRSYLDSHQYSEPTSLLPVPSNSCSVSSKILSSCDPQATFLTRDSVTHESWEGTLGSWSKDLGLFYFWASIDKLIICVVWYLRSLRTSQTSGDLWASQASSLGSMRTFGPWCKPAWLSLHTLQGTVPRFQWLTWCSCPTRTIHLA